MKLWGKTLIARREYLARRDQEAKTPAALGQRYGQAMHFGTDIPAPTWQEVEAERARHGRDDAGHMGKWIAAIAFLLPIALVLALVYLIRQ
jgi:hypothetical protein